MLDLSFKAINLRVTSVESVKCDISDMNLLTQENILCVISVNGTHQTLMNFVFRKFTIIRAANILSMSAQNFNLT
jgi:hypothetical protein